MTTCMAPDCQNTVERKAVRGPNPKYCSPACRPSYYKPESRRFLVEVGHEPTDEGARPFGPVFFVEIKKGKVAVTVSSNLSRPSADHLARRLRQLFEGSDETKATDVS